MLGKRIYYCTYIWDCFLIKIIGGLNHFCCCLLLFVVADNQKGIQRENYHDMINGELFVKLVEDE